MIKILKTRLKEKDELLDCLEIPMYEWRTLAEIEAISQPAVTFLDTTTFPVTSFILIVLDLLLKSYGMKLIDLISKKETGGVETEEAAFVSKADTKALPFTIRNLDDGSLAKREFVDFSDTAKVFFEKIASHLRFRIMNRSNLNGPELLAMYCDPLLENYGILFSRRRRSVSDRKRRKP